MRNCVETDLPETNARFKIDWYRFRYPAPCSSSSGSRIKCDHTKNPPKNHSIFAREKKTKRNHSIVLRICLSRKTRSKFDFLFLAYVDHLFCLQPQNHFTTSPRSRCEGCKESKKGGCPFSSHLAEGGSCPNRSRTERSQLRLRLYAVDVHWPGSHRDSQGLPTIGSIHFPRDHSQNDLWLSSTVYCAFVWHSKLKDF